jgi:hypothetical protein
LFLAAGSFDQHASPCRVLIACHAGSVSRPANTTLRPQHDLQLYTATPGISTQLRVYYADARALLPPSDQEASLTALNLLRLLVQNRIAEFHTELEVVPQQVLASPEVGQVVELEQWLMEGAYNKVLDARARAANEYWHHFLDQLSSTVR